MFELSDIFLLKNNIQRVNNCNGLDFLIVNKQKRNNNLIIIIVICKIQVKSN